jgi:hypothetical protein
MAASGRNTPDWRFFQVFGEEQPEGSGVEDIQEGVLPVRLEQSLSGDQQMAGIVAKHGVASAERMLQMAASADARCVPLI